MPVRLRDAQIDRQVRATREPDLMIDHNTPAPVGFGQAVDAELAAEPAAVERDRTILKRYETDLARHDIRLVREPPAVRLIEPQIDAREIAGGHRRPRERARRGFAHLPLRIEEVDRRKARDAV